MARVCACVLLERICVQPWLALFSQGQPQHPINQFNPCTLFPAPYAPNPNCLTRLLPRSSAPPLSHARSAATKERAPSPCLSHTCLLIQSHARPCSAVLTPLSFKCVCPEPACARPALCHAVARALHEASTAVETEEPHEPPLDFDPLGATPLHTRAPRPSASKPPARTPAGEAASCAQCLCSSTSAKILCF